MKKNPLLKYFETNKSKRIHKWIHYFDIYHQYFNRFRNKPITFLEIGVQNGGSLEMWRKYFGPKATIIGVDIMPECKQFESKNTHIRIGDQESPEFWRTIRKEFPSIDILLDDGGHTVNQQIVTFKEMYQYISNNGIYLCEDLHTNYWSDFGGGYRKNSTFISYMKNLIDDMHAWHSHDKEVFSVTDYTKSIKGMHIYDSVIVLEKSIVLPPQSKMTGFIAKVIDNGLPTQPADSKSYANELIQTLRRMLRPLRALIGFVTFRYTKQR